MDDIAHLINGSHVIAVVVVEVAPPGSCDAGGWK